MKFEANARSGMTVAARRARVAVTEKLLGHHESIRQAQRLRDFDTKGRGA
jgi:hypothetical protein